MGKSWSRHVWPAVVAAAILMGLASVPSASAAPRGADGFDAAPLAPQPVSPGAIAAPDASPPFPLYLPVRPGERVNASGPHYYCGYVCDRIAAVLNSVDLGYSGDQKGTMPVLAAADGVLTFHTDTGYYSNGDSTGIPYPNCWASIDSPGGWSTTYYHLTNAELTLAGTSVHVGDRIATDGYPNLNTCGFGSPAHVHFSLWQNGQPVAIDGTSIGGYTVHGGTGTCGYGGSSYYGSWTRNSDGAVVVPPGCGMHAALINDQVLPPPPATWVPDRPVAGNWDGSRKGGSASWLLRNTNKPGNPNLSVDFGGRGDIEIAGDWNGDGVVTLGVYRPPSGTQTSSEWLLRNSNTPGNPDIDVLYGGAGDIPVVGDWNGDGVTTIGVYRPAVGEHSSSEWLLRNSNTPGTADIDVLYGGGGDRAVAGDWNGDGTDTIGVFRPPSQGGTDDEWLLRNSNSAGRPDLDVKYGGLADVPVVGDWNGDGTTTIGVYRLPSNGALSGEWLFRDTNTPGRPNVDVLYGGAGDVPVVGDWDGDGRTTIGVYRPAPPADSFTTAGVVARAADGGVTWELRNANSSGDPAGAFEYGAVGDIAVVGDWNGDGVVTLGVYRPSAGEWLLRNSNTPGNPEIDVLYGGASDIPVVGDWNGDGTDTIGVYRPSTGEWLLRNSNTAGNPDIDVPYGGATDLPVAGDWNGDGTDTIGVYRPPAGAQTSGEWLLRNSNTPGSPDLDILYGGGGDTPVAGDWNGDGTVTIGVFTPAPTNSAGVWKLRDSNTPGNPTLQFAYGGGVSVPT